MENYFQAEAFNLDKVLDEFEQNEDETDTPPLSDAKWTHILAPSTHLLSLNPAIGHTDEDLRHQDPPPMSVKPLREGLCGAGEDLTNRNGQESTLEPEAWISTRPLFPQPNIGKLVSSQGEVPVTVSPSSAVQRPDSGSLSPALENGCLDLNGCSEEPDSGEGFSEDSPPVNQIRIPESYYILSAPLEDLSCPMEMKDSCFKESHYSLEDEKRMLSSLRVKDLTLNEVEQLHSYDSITGSPKGNHDLDVGKKPSSPWVKHRDVMESVGGDSKDLDSMPPENIVNGGIVELNEHEETQIPGIDYLSLQQQTLSLGDMKFQRDSSPVHSLPRGCDVESLGFIEDDRASQTPPSKEDSVTEEKEMEESKLESSEQTHGSEVCGVEAGARSQTLADGHLQPVSTPYGGARPKQSVTMKLLTPRLLLGQVLNELGSHGKNKNLESQCETGAEISCADEHGEDPGLTRMNGESGAGGFDSGRDLMPSLLLPLEGPDNDVQAGHLGLLSKKPFSALGEVAPVWVPDSQAPICMKCEVKFTFTKRRHHCRACGKVFCATCCSLKYRLMYMDRKEARVCITCHSVLMSTWENIVNASNQSPNPNNPAEYCSTIPPLQQAQASGVLSSPPPTVMVPVGVLKHPGAEGTLSRDQKRVWFADGILPNGEVADSSKMPASIPAPSGPLTVSHDSGKPPAADVPGTDPVPPAQGVGAPAGSPVGSSVNLIPADGLPPILISTGIKGDYAVEERPSEILLMQQLEEGGPDPLVFVLNANLLAMVKLVNYVNRKCWCVTTKGMHAVGQAEVVVLLQCLPDEKSIPKDIFSHFVQLYQEALAGNVVCDLGHSFFTQSFLGSREHGGFLYISPTFQSLQDLLLPNPPYLFGILIQKWETPWAKVFPLRLMLRLGAEYRFYPCPLFSVRFRKPLFGETGHTIMNLLADFRNYQYSLPVVTGLVVDMEVQRTCIKIPSNHYNELMKAMNKSNEHVLAVGACFNERADSHLVCVQNDDGNYQTQAISIHNQPRKVTGACFFVFSGALKASSGYLAKSSIVEDGVMVQITAETMEELRQALREMKDYTIACGKADQEDSQEHVHIQWLEDDRNFNKGVISPIDGKSMESISSIKIFHGSEYKANGKVIRWTEVFFLQSEDQPNGPSDPADHSRLTENVARAFCVALCPHLKLLKEDGMAKLGLRVTLDSDQVGYMVGSNGQPLLPQYMKDLDSALVPVIHGGACQLSEGPVEMELIFYILENIS
ncbi:zinc finger FYVE domain-containing protein 9-like [Megalops cyprinoides]|uniref:zinc finger FYVE domain-containing protein 9-like n=1 Tax=Megalops cyprinoides TaxID=118141 RepID=UPI001864C0F6|nr:zinc finger FYVE domain-containing protein 9-like [Megalops cyprinoides]